jgi:hypothetical protein
MARTAVIAGTASATAGAVSRRQSAKAQQQQQLAEMESQAQMAEMQAQLAAQQAQQQPAAAPAGDDDVLAKLQQLADLKAAGVLDDAEFAAAKAKLLG